MVAQHIVFWALHDSHDYILLTCRVDVRTANIVVDSPGGVDCLVIDRESYTQLISNIDDLQTGYDDQEFTSNMSVFFTIFDSMKHLRGIL